MSDLIGGLGRWAFALGLSACLVGEATSADEGRGRAVLAAQKIQKKKAAARKGDDAMAKPDAGAAPATSPTPASTTPADGSLSFKRDIAPILVANCQGCHTGNGQGLRRSKFDMTTFEKLMAGGNRGKDIVGGDAEGSTLVRMIKGEESPKMPPNNGQRGFSAEAAEKIQTWVQQGAKLDAGIAPNEPIAKYAATLDDLRRAELSKLSPEERDKVAEQVGRDRWKKASKVEPEVTTSKGGHFLLLSTLPKERATKLIQAMEAQFAQANRLLSASKAAPALSPTEKIGLYVFKEQAPFVEFIRAVENADVEAGEQARARLGVESPYIVAVDPAAGGEEANATPARKGVRGKKKADESAGGPDRILAGLLTEQLVAGATLKAGKPPRWVSLGLGAYLASRLEPGSPYYRGLRKETSENIRIGWQAKANSALGGEEKTETVRAIGFSLFEWMSAKFPPSTVASFVQVMLDGQGKTDDAIAQCLGGTRQEFLEQSELWIGEKYGSP